MYTYPPDWVSEAVRVLVSPDVTMITDPPLWISLVDDSPPNACLDQMNTFIAVVLEAEVAIQVRVKLFEGGTSITVV